MRQNFGEDKVFCFYIYQLVKVAAMGGHNIPLTFEFGWQLQTNLSS